MTLRQKICDGGINTLREYMCLEVGGDTIVYENIAVDSSMVFIAQEKLISVSEISDVIGVTEVDAIMVDEISDYIEITEEDEDNVDEL